MRSFGILAALAVAAVSVTAPVAARGSLSDAEIKQQIIRQSIASYPGSCACPYNTARNGSSCGGRSAWSRGGGYAPICYAREVSAADVKAYRSNR